MNAEQLITAAVQAGASDIHIVCGMTPRIRKAGRLVPLWDDILTDEDCDSSCRYG